MASLKEQLTQLLPGILPKSSEDAINGTELLEKVQPQLHGEYAESSLRQHFSVMSADPTSPIAKVDQGQGYYFRTVRPQTPIEDKSSEAPPTQLTDGSDSSTSGRAEQREEKFRSLFIRWAESNNQFPMFIEHLKGTRQIGGINKWKFPDVVLVKWEVGEITDRGFRLAKDLLEVKRSLGEQPFRLTSVELKVELTASTLRQAFFQCVSNSKWAHSAQLTVACRLADEVVAEELRRLGASYDVSVVSFGLDTQLLESLPSADLLSSMPQPEFEKHTAKISLTRISQGKDRENLDWEHIRDLKLQSPDVSDLFAWVAYCLEKKSPYSARDWRNIAKVEKSYA